ncbi:MAG TPA: hypothetical protein VKT80_02220 [Chloroflexota bacterium]|nr:hypothetical protein [Chloroflexota bacterium]
MLSHRVTEQWLIFPGFEFVCPGNGWTSDVAAAAAGLPCRQSVVVTRGREPDPVESVAIWSMTLPPEFRGLDPDECATAYFEAEREAPRMPGKLWSGFVAEDRLIDGRRFPTMRFDLTDEPGSLPPFPPVSGVFVVCFPTDFRQKPRFSVLMFQVDRWSTLDGDGLDGLVDTVVASFVEYPSGAGV